MTEMQFNEIKERLADWRSERGLTYENQREEFLGNVFEKVSEYFRAKDDLERVEALCDIAVFFFNAFELKFGAFSNIKRAGMIHLIDHFTSYFLEHNNKTVYNNSKDEDFEYLLIVEIEILVKNLGFDFYKCMLETIKEMESITGYYDKGLNKFTKDKGAYNTKEAYDKFLKENISDDFYILEDNEEFVIFDKENDFALDKFKKWHKADYESCRI
ncbi:hypothetical protein DKJ77_06350 [Campylobacter coli]|nr:hypothetical protein [Campylobacter coli]EAI2940901.1 hypothetical protein [Campylobacter coli]EAI9620814.1 hypothetical protein [Campylobacter coli]EAJ4967082.1 hypothetical protein [Campylobacter coli]EAJ9895039.1 hypothetical protein [Campylobacter coli]